ncbi:MAG TPA: dihydroorotate dehydrogenase electron transfer subunit [Candidatus Kapabacteria bacterium]|nr:dihydroorotate dehydrogenase electron transfer subunit [Candidatus Kapabacteria bacterium]
MLAPIIEKRTITKDLFVLRIEAPAISSITKPGQFVNILPRTNSTNPLLRRPFSVYQCGDNWIEIIVQIHGSGTQELAYANKGELIDILGPLGMPWKVQSNNYSTAILVVGGVGVASMPLLTKFFHGLHTPFATYYGARTASLFADEYLQNISYATDDGSKGFQGNVIDLLRNDLLKEKHLSPKLFVCGPTPMMRAAVTLAEEFQIPCEVSLETEMACGVGICQGCPVVTTEKEFSTSGKKFHLVCMHGPSFEREQIIF